MPVLPLILAVVALVGVAVLMYPQIAGWFSQYAQSRVIEEYSVGLSDDQVLADEIAAARAYNAGLVGGDAAVAAGERVVQSVSGAASDDDVYDSLLNADGHGVMARIKIPSIGVDLPILHGTSDDVLEKAIGHLEGTALPVGGVDTHSVLTGHRGLASAELFTNLDKVAEGDTFTIEVFGEVLTYRVVRTLVVAPDETETLYPERGRDLVTLVTCTPLGINSHRILVTAERITPTPIEDVQAAGAVPDVPGFPWWALVLGGAVVVAGVYVWVSGRPGVVVAPTSATAAGDQREAT
ncbi:class C sortase [Microbacterium sp. C7(2022)]|nr:class C sortase [Microbacterium sp. C7(2022)]